MCYQILCWTNSYMGLSLRINRSSGARNRVTRKKAEVSGRAKPAPNLEVLLIHGFCLQLYLCSRLGFMFEVPNRRFVEEFI